MEDRCPGMGSYPGMFIHLGPGGGGTLLYSVSLLQEPVAIEGPMAAWGMVGLKYSIHCYSIMGRPIGQETDAIEKIWCLIVPKGRRHATPHRAPPTPRQHQGGQEAAGRGNRDKILYYSSCREEQGRQGEQAYDCLV